ncbi:hypothetical protein [Siphonobacter aquaeclarae]|uniref:Uncharacterized protein n=1 Tax=Siphonobacter aquaeclarae TaxID=563176 RepID=A0A1G9T8A5_9BACT|nr:hypothetical protein [Siphonobacter aquaeclarae]SDM43979.1 hypothetical protein SAMN04488090_3457 [Siphonobacter aquaeclarae]
MTATLVVMGFMFGVLAGITGTVVLSYLKEYQHFNEVTRPQINE